MLTNSSANNTLTSYEILKADSESKRQKVFYFDAFDVAKIIQGHLAFEYGTHFDKTAFIKSEDFLVHCFAGKGWLGNIYMLTPHEEEIIVKIDRLFHAAYAMSNSKPELVLNELLPELRLTTLMGSGASSLDNEKIKKYIEDLKYDARLLFKLNCILEQPTWFSRYTKLIRGGVINFDKESFEQTNYWEKEEYKFILDAISQQRDNKLSGKNNEKDAQALTLLHEKLKNAEKDPSKPMPVFFSSHPVLKRALDKINKIEPYFFTFRHKGENIPIVRDARYFILYQIFNFNEENASAKFLNQMTELKSTVDRIFQNYQVKKIIGNSSYSGYEHFENEINTVVLNEFLNHVWLENDGIRKLADEIENVIHLDKNQPMVEEYFKKERASFYQNFGEKIELGRLSTKLWNELPSVFREFVIQHKDYTRKPDFDIFSHFGLLRFGLDKRIFESIIQKRYEFIVNAVQKIDRLDGRAEKLTDEELYELRKSEHDLIGEVSIMVSVLVQGLSAKHQDEDFVACLSILWLLEKYELIVEICDALNHNYSYYQIAFLHTAAINFSNIGRKDTAIRIIENIEHKLNILKAHPYYNLWIGLSFTHFNIWYRGSNRPVLPEWNNFPFNDMNYDHFRHAIKYLKSTIAYLGKTKDDTPKQIQKNRKYFYALNNLIYYITKGGTQKEFEEIKNYINDFRAFEAFANIWQNRFYDTLAWYFLRKAVLDLNQGKNASFKYYINLAAQKNERSMEYLFSKREKQSYLQLKERIEEVKMKNDDLYKSEK